MFAGIAPAVATASEPAVDPLTYEITPPWVQRATRVGPRQILVNLVDGTLAFGIWSNEAMQRSPPEFLPNAFSTFTNTWIAESTSGPLGLTVAGAIGYPEQSARNAPRKPQRRLILLQTDRDLEEGETIRLRPSSGGAELTVSVATSALSDLVHVPHQGFVPTSPDKHALLGGWFGPDTTSDGWLSEARRFAVVDVATGRPAPGWGWDDGHTLELTRRGDVVHAYAWQASNSWATRHDVYVARFPGLRTPGTYRVEVEGVGASYPFAIREHAHRPLIRHLARGFIHLQHDDDRRAEAVAPELVIPPTLRHMEFVPVLRTFASISPDGIGDQGKLWEPWPIQPETDPQLLAFGVDRPTEGWRDAADYDIRPLHLEVATEMLWFSFRFPVLDTIAMGRAESGEPYRKVIRGRAYNGTVVLPDWFHLALSCGDAFTRLQVDTPGFWFGSVRGGFEMRGYISPNVDFQSYSTRFKPEDRMHLVRPDPWATYAYAAFAAAAALKFERLGEAGLAETYGRRAHAAWDWAARHEGDTDLESWNPAWRAHRAFLDAKANAAVALWALTGDEAFARVFASVPGHTTPVPRTGRSVAARAYWMLHQAGIRRGDPAILRSIRGQTAALYRATLAHVHADPARSPSPMIFDRPTGPIGHGDYGFSIHHPYSTVHTWFPILLLLDEPDHGLGPEARINVQRWVEADLAYATGRNPHGRAFITGFGHNPPRSIHHNELQGSGLTIPFPGLIAFGLVSDGRLSTLNSGEGYEPAIETLPYHYRLVFGIDIHRTMGEFTPQNSLWPLLTAVIAADHLGAPAP